MFWSPAVATFRVWAPAVPVIRKAARPAAHKLLCMETSLVRISGEQVQRRQRQAQAHRTVELVVAIVRHSEMTAADGDHIPVVSARIRSLRDLSGKNDGAVDPRIRIDERSDVVAKMSRHRTDRHRAAPGGDAARVGAHLDAGAKGP